MAQGFDYRIVPERLITLLRRCQARVPFHLGGGAALAGVYLKHRLSNDVDLFVHDRATHRDLVAAFLDAAGVEGLAVRVIRDGGTFVRAELELPGGLVAADLVHDPVPDVETPPAPIDGIVVESLADLRANKLTCILSRSEPRDLVDLLFLDRAGFPPELDTPLALSKDAGIDPSVLAWLLREFPLEPLPMMLVPLDVNELRTFRDNLAERLRRLAVPDDAAGDGTPG